MSSRCLFLSFEDKIADSKVYLHTSLAWISRTRVVDPMGLRCSVPYRVRGLNWLKSGRCDSDRNVQVRFDLSSYLKKKNIRRRMNSQPTCRCVQSPTCTGRHPKRSLPNFGTPPLTMPLLWNCQCHMPLEVESGFPGCPAACVHSVRGNGLAECRKHPESQTVWRRPQTVGYPPLEPSWLGLGLLQDPTERLVRPSHLEKRGERVQVGLLTLTST